jgi:hypothetical protein
MIRAPRRSLYTGGGVPAPRENVGEKLASLSVLSVLAFVPAAAQGEKANQELSVRVAVVYSQDQLGSSLLEAVVEAFPEGAVVDRRPYETVEQGVDHFLDLFGGKDAVDLVFGPSDVETFRQARAAVHGYLESAEGEALPPVVSSLLISTSPWNEVDPFVSVPPPANERVAAIFDFLEQRSAGRVSVVYDEFYRESAVSSLSGRRDLGRTRLHPWTGVSASSRSLLESVLDERPDAVALLTGPVATRQLLDEFAERLGAQALLVAAARPALRPAEQAPDVGRPYSVAVDESTGVGEGDWTERVVRAAAKAISVAGRVPPASELATEVRKETEVYKASVQPANGTVNGEGSYLTRVWTWGGRYPLLPWVLALYLAVAHAFALLELRDKIGASFEWLTRQPPVYVLTGLHFALSTAMLVLLLQSLEALLTWPGALLAGLLPYGFRRVEILSLGRVTLGTRYAYDALLGAISERVMVNQYRDHEAAVDLLVLYNSLGFLQSTVMDRLGPKTLPPMRRERLQRELFVAGSVQDKKLVFSQTLVRSVSWSRLVEMGAVPLQYQHSVDVPNLRQVLGEAVHKLSLDGVQSESLDTFIRGTSDRWSTTERTHYQRKLDEVDVSDERSRLYAQVAYLMIGRGMDLAAPDVLEQLESDVKAFSERSTTKPPQEDVEEAEQRRQAPTLQVQRVVLTNIRCFREVELDFRGEAGARRWAILLGDNGVGKTTLLRGIALGLCSSTGAVAYMEALKGELLRRDTDEGTILVELASADEPEQIVWSKLTLSRTTRGVVMEQSLSEGFPRDQIFVAAYGAMRQVSGPISYPGYSVEDAVQSLFKNDTKLQNAELVLRRIESTVDIDPFLRRLESVLTLKPGDIRLEPTGIEVRGPWGHYAPAEVLGDGYQATMSWLTDLLGWALHYAPSDLGSGLSCIVLIDELEKHLHPRWQREIVSGLHDQFPNVQFIATTHSPICASGLADLGEEDGRMFAFQAGRDTPNVESMPPLTGWTFDEIATSSAFGLTARRDKKTEAAIDEVREAFESGGGTTGEPKVEAAMKELRDLSIEASSEVQEEIRNRSLDDLLERIRRAEEEQKGRADEEETE